MLRRECKSGCRCSLTIRLCTLNGHWRRDDWTGFPVTQHTERTSRHRKVPESALECEELFHWAQLPTGHPTCVRDGEKSGYAFRSASKPAFLNAGHCRSGTFSGDARTHKPVCAVSTRRWLGCSARRSIILSGTPSGYSTFHEHRGSRTALRAQTVDSLQLTLGQP